MAGAAPGVLRGTWICVKLLRMIPEGLFFAIIHVLLTIAGAKLIFGALT